MRLIDADALHKTKIVERKQIFVDGKRRVTNLYTEVVMAVHVENAPTIDPESLRPTGEWIHEGDGWDECWKCSACKEYFAFEYDPTDEETFVKYCPNCGAKMKGAGENADN